VAITVTLNPRENLWWDLKKAVAARKPKDITELEVIAFEEWAQIPQKCCQKLLSGYTFHYFTYNVRSLEVAFFR